MTDKKTPTKRRAVSKARLYKEIVAAMTTHFDGPGSGATVDELLDALKDDIVQEAIGE